MIHRRRDAVSEVPHRRSKLRTVLLGIVGAFLAFALAIPVANAAEVMRVTFVRHGESYGNTSGKIDTSTPGPVLTPAGQQQAKDIVKVLGDNNYDAIYASTMVRTQLTAAPMSQYLGLPVQVLPGLQEIEAGNYEGTAEGAAAFAGYLVAPIAWSIGQPFGSPTAVINRAMKMPCTADKGCSGLDLDGNIFDARVDGALQTMYDNGDRNPIVFSHGGTIMFWTFMNATNIDTATKIRLLTTAPLRNTNYVVVEGNNEDGWVLVNWNGEEFGTQPTFETNVNLQIRTLTRQLSAAAKQVTDSFPSGDPVTIATAVNRGAAAAGFSALKFGRAINAEVLRRVEDAIPQSEEALQQKVTTQVDNIKAAVNNTAGKVTQDVQDVQDQGAVVTSSTPKLSSVKSKVKDAFKAQPGSTKSANEAGKKVRESVKKSSDQLKSTVQKVSDAVKKATDGASDDSKPAADKDAA